jgi:hypothetical protein
LQSIFSSAYFNHFYGRIFFMLKLLIDTKDYDGIEKALIERPEWANEGIPFDEKNTKKAHPLHRLCDGVFNGRYSDEEAVRMATLLLSHGAKINGDGHIPKHDTPLIAACSLLADKLALLYIDRGADIFHAGTHGGTALHWAAWCGRNNVVKKLIEKGAAVNQLCIDFKSTPLLWAVHGLKKWNDRLQERLDCINFLLAAGADKSIPNADGKSVDDLIGKDDTELLAALAYH